MKSFACLLFCVSLSACALFSPRSASLHDVPRPSPECWGDPIPDGDLVVPGMAGQIVPPEIERFAEPQYPEVLRREGIHGEVVVLVVVDRGGRVVTACLEEKTASPLDEIAVAAALECTFRPGTLDGQPVVMKSSIPYDFALF